MQTQKFLYRVRFSRNGLLRFLSHREQIKLIRRAIRRSRLPVSFTEGFHPQLKVSFGPAISVGYSSNCELVDIETNKIVDTREFAKQLLAQLPEGFSLVEIKRIPSFFGSIESVVNLVEYSIDNISEFLDIVEIEAAIKEFFNKKEFCITIAKKGKVQEVDIVPLIREMYFSGNKLVLRLRFGPKKNIKPEKIVESVFNLSAEKVRLLKVCREMLYVEKSDGTIMNL